MKKISFLAFSLTALFFFTASSGGDKLTEDNISSKTQMCIGCHTSATPGIVGDWKKSRHSSTTLNMALEKKEIERRVSVTGVPDPALDGVVVGCYECHSLNTEKHSDSFKHYGNEINIIVSPLDCATCHPEEQSQFSGSKKFHAHDNLKKNPVYTLLVETITSTTVFDGSFTATHSENAANESCYACHGTDVQVVGTRKVETDLGEIEVPKLSNWPNHGVGRINPDGSRGACSACHPRHSFDIKIARKPETCGQCHLKPDVPAYDVYKESKHGNIYYSYGEDWNFDNVPWTLGDDFTAPTCASCHNSLVDDTEGEVIAERSHDFGSRLWVTIFGLIYSHPYTADPATYNVKNKDGMPLPTTFDNIVAEEFVISEDEQQKKKEKLTSVCKGCHSTSYVEGQMEILDRTITDADKMVKAATDIMSEGWMEKIENPDNPFDELLEIQWIKQWLFYANSVRYASAMMGPDYAGFKNGWWDLTHNLRIMKDLLESKKVRK